jgi:predicted acylesterase/phospholipase RssA
MRPRPPFECVALLLQSGDALRAYQARVYEASTETNLHPDWIAGISIAAINGALIAGNPPEACIGWPVHSGSALLPILCRERALVAD